jgi:hypothetical protein
VKRLKLDIPALVSQKVHHHLQVCLRADVAGHDTVIRPIEQDLAKQLERLSLVDVVGGENERRIHREELRRQLDPYIVSPS